MLDHIVAGALGAATHGLTGAQVRWRGCEPKAVSRLYYANHSSHADFVLIWWAFPPHLRKNVRPVVSADYWNQSPVRRYLIDEVFHAVVIDRAPRCARRAIEALCEAVDEGSSLIVFPEGTRNANTDLLPFKGGIYHLARSRPNLELVPVWIENLNRAFPKGRLLPLPLLCTATFGTPLRIEPGQNKNAFLERARTALLSCRT